MNTIPPIGHPVGENFRRRVTERLHELKREVNETDDHVRKVLDPHADSAKKENDQQPPQIQGSGPAN